MITFKYIREKFDKERKHRTIQRLEDDFINKINEYLERKEKIIKRSSKTIIDYSLINEVENFKSLLKNLLEIREKKILMLALNHTTSKNTSSKIEENLLEIEKELYKKICEILQEYKEKISSFTQPLRLDEKNHDEKNGEEKGEGKNNSEEIEVKEKELEIRKDGEKIEKEKENEEKSNKKYMVEALESIPSFLTPSREFIGPFMKGEKFVCEEKVKELLLKLNKIKVLYEM